MITEPLKVFRGEILEDVEKYVQDQKFKAAINALQIPERYKKPYLVKNEQQEKILNLVNEYIETAQENIKQGKNVFFIGRMGTGKTHLSFYLAENLVKKGFSARYTTADDLTQEIRSTWNPGSLQTTADIFSKYQKVKFLILDEIGVNCASDSEIKDLYKILNFRYNQQLPTLFISNLPFSELSEYIGARSFDKIKENCLQPLFFTWQSLRS